MWVITREKDLDRPADLCYTEIRNLKSQISDGAVSRKGLAMILLKLEQRNVSEQIYDLLRAKIISQEFALGQRLDLDQIEQQLGVSRTPLKQALGRLSVEGLVEIRSRKGTFVTAPTLQEMAEAFDVRAVLEAYALELLIPRLEPQQLAGIRAMVRRLGQLVEEQDWNQIYQEYVAVDHQMHRWLVELSGNHRLLWFHDNANTHVQMARVRYAQAEEQLRLAQKEHEQILAALEARDVAAAVQAVKAHLQRSKYSLLEDMRRTWQSQQAAPGA